jgi:hypothetical protein
MSEAKIQPSTITKPMQMLAAWLVGLLAIDSTFLLAATRMPSGSAEATALIWAAILNVPLFIVALFLLQTRFRPELQEDLYYSTYISQKTNETLAVTRKANQTVSVTDRVEKVEGVLVATDPQGEKSQHLVLLSTLDIAVNRHLSDKDEIAKKLFNLEISSHTWFGSETPPKDRVISFSSDLSKQTRDLVLMMASELGFKRYNVYDALEEDIVEDVLIGSYGPSRFEIPNFARKLKN